MKDTNIHGVLWMFWPVLREKCSKNNISDHIHNMKRLTLRRIMHTKGGHAEFRTHVQEYGHHTVFQIHQYCGHIICNIIVPLLVKLHSLTASCYTTLSRLCWLLLCRVASWSSTSPNQHFVSPWLLHSWDAKMHAAVRDDAFVYNALTFCEVTCPRVGWISIWELFRGSDKPFCSRIVGNVL